MAATTVVFYVTSPKGKSHAIEDRVYSLLGRNLKAKAEFHKGYFNALPISGETVNTVIWIGSITLEDDKHSGAELVAVLEPGEPSLLDQITGREPEYILKVTALVKTDKFFHGGFDDPSFLDVDGSGQKAFAVHFSFGHSGMGDQSTSLLLFRRITNSWKVFTLPPFKHFLKYALTSEEELFMKEQGDHISGDTIFINDLPFELVEIFGVGDYYFVNDEGSKTTDTVCAVVPILGAREGILDGHRLAIVPFGLTDSGFVRNEYWNNRKRMLRLTR